MTSPTTQATAYAKPPRIGLVDTARGAALIAMATYHFSWDLEFMGYLAPGTAETGWLKIYARAIATTFLFIVGVSLVLSSRPEIRWRAFWKRFGMIAGAAVLISAATMYFVPGEWIYFGILHSIAVLSLIGVVFLRLPLPVTLLVTLALLVGWIADTFVMPGVLDSHLFDPKYLAWLGFAATPDRSNDFVPLFPWATPFFLGIVLTRLTFLTSLPQRLAALGTGGTWLAWLGRHSLAFYLIHQPVLITVAYGLTFVVAPPKPDPVATYLRQCNTSCTVEQGEAVCRSFCQCTLDQLQAQQLFTQFQAGQVKADDERIMALASQCSAQIEPEPAPQSEPRPQQ
ncbi:putative membrane protein [Rhizobium sp. BK529]|uniref:heparan-alpha-glucosaminide N-acetyltransferase n=1 Tax=unclassified Rhizobium TaxID=2613769 RepID=UPI00104DF68E|nr:MULTISPECIES: heparan-alpha-glucosaminide N-acetyltransferase [unclassified Rhizobium]MBB3591183.1 putative membrane protein [Rhizobium sp. BK529]TCS08862.1 putative membrane protein [Rhizobium sp. BK418]